MCIARRMSSRRARPTRTKARAKRYSASSAPARPKRSSLFAAPPKPSTWSPPVTAASSSARTTRSCSSTLEHHSNIVPWQFLAEQVGAVIRVVPVTDRGEVLLSDFEKTLSTRTRFVALTHVSNALGTILPVREMIDIAHRRGAKVLIDGAQAVSHFPVNVQSLDADFYALSGHKLFGPSAIGVLYGKKALLDEMPPWQGGGNMIQRVTFENSTFADPPQRFEAGTAALGPAVGLGAAVDYLDRIGMENVATS